MGQSHSNKSAQANIFGLWIFIGIFFLVLPYLLKITPDNYFVALISLLVFIISSNNTNFALCILILSMLLSPEIKIGELPGRPIVVRLDDIFLLVILLAWLVRMSIKKELGFLRKTPLNGPILAYIAVCAISTLIGAINEKINISFALFYLMKYIEYFIVYFMVINNVTSIRQVKVFITLIILTGFIISVYGYSQYFSGVESRISTPFETAGGEPNTLGVYLLLIMAQVLGLLLYTKKIRTKPFLFAALALMLGVFMLTYSRGSWLAFFPMYLTLMFFTKRYKLTLVVTMLLFLTFSGFILPEKVKQRVQETFLPERSITVFDQEVTLDESTFLRVDSYKKSISEWSKSPIFGYGILGAGEVFDFQYGRILVEIGLVGFLIFIWLIIRIYKAGILTFRVCEGNDLFQGISLGFIAGLSGILLHGFTAATFILVRVMEPFWFLAAIVVVLPQIYQDNKLQRL